MARSLDFLKVPLRRVAACAVVATLLVASAVASAGTTLDRIRDRQTIVFAYRDGTSPFSFKDRGGQVRGYSVDLCAGIARAIQKQLGLAKLAVEWMPVNGDTRLEAVASGRADAECGTTTITLTRMERVDFSVPIFVDGATLAVRAQSSVRRLADLNGRRVAVVPGTTTERALLVALKAVGVTAVLVPVTKPAEGAVAVREGRADAVAGDRIVLTQIALSADDVALPILPEDFSYEPYAIVVRRDDPDFRLAVNRALVEMYKRGDAAPIYQRWLAPLGKPSPLLNAMFYLNGLPE